MSIQVYQNWLCQQILCSTSDLIVEENAPPKCPTCGGPMVATNRYVREDDYAALEGSRPRLFDSTERAA